MENFEFESNFDTKDTLDLDALGEDELSREIATSRVQPSHWHLKHSLFQDTELFAKFLRVCPFAFLPCVFAYSQDEEQFTSDHMVPYRWLAPSEDDKAFDNAEDAFVLSDVLPLPKYLTSSHKQVDKASGDFEAWQQSMAKLVSDRKLEFENVAVTFAGDPH